MKQITTGDLLHAYGSFGLHLDYSVRLTVKLTDLVDGVILSNALRKTQQRFAFLSVCMRKDSESLYYEENLNPVVLLNTDAQISLNSEQSNFHVWAVCYKDDRIHLDIYHGISDGTGMYMVLSTLLFYYCAGRYGISDHTGIRTLEDPVEPEESTDPQDYLPILAPEQMPKPRVDPAFSMIEDGQMTPSTPKVWDIETPEEAFMRFTSANDASPGTMISQLIAHALDEMYPERSKPITSSYIINGRPMLHFPKTHHNCVNTVFFNYNDRIRAMPFDRQCTVYRGITFIQSDEERVAGAMTVGASRNRMVLGMSPTYEARKNAFGQMLAGGKRLFSYMVSYVGKWKFKSLEPYILEFWTHVPIANDFLVEIAAVNGKIFLTIHQSFAEENVIHGFLDQLRKHGIPFQIKRTMDNDVAVFPEP